MQRKPHMGALLCSRHSCREVGVFSKAAELLLDLTLELDTDRDTEGEVGLRLDELGGIDFIGELIQDLLMGRGELMLELPAHSGLPDRSRASQRGEAYESGWDGTP